MQRPKKKQPSQHKEDQHAYMRFLSIPDLKARKARMVAAISPHVIIVYQDRR